MKAIKTWEEADDALRQLGVAEIELERIEQKLTLDTQKLKVAAEEKATAPRARSTDLREALEAFWKDHRGEVKGKSWDGTFGEIGQRTGKASVKILKGWTLEQVLEVLEGAGFGELIRTKQELRKPEIIANQVDLTPYGIAVKPGKERFFAEPDRERALLEEIPS